MPFTNDFINIKCILYLLFLQIYWFVCLKILINNVLLINIFNLRRDSLGIQAIFFTIGSSLSVFVAIVISVHLVTPLERIWVYILQILLRDIRLTHLSLILVLSLQRFLDSIQRPLSLSRWIHLGILGIWEVNAVIIAISPENICVSLESGG